MRSVRNAIPILAAAAAAACASSPQVAGDVREGDPAVLNRDCKLLGTVNGRSLFGGISDETKTTAAMNDAREKAAKLGATHLVYVSTDKSGAFGSGYATARAYRCDKTS